MTYLLDTSAFSELMRKEPKSVARLASTRQNDDVFTCSIIRGEILYGLALMPDGKRRRDLTQRASDIFADCLCQSVPASAGDRYAEIKSKARSQGYALG